MGMDAYQKHLQEQAKITETGRHNVSEERISVSNNAANNATSIKTTGMNNATSRANNRDTQAGENLRAGVGPDGQLAGDVQSIVDAIGQYKVAPPNGMALRNPRMQSILAQVTAQYPEFDSTQYGARQVAAKSFATGLDGQKVQAANTALNHLDTLRTLAEAQANGNIPLFNQLANAYAKQTGQAAPTNLQGAITMVGPEISKAVIGSGGGVSDRDKVDSALAALSKGSPKQAAGQIAIMEDLFGGRLSEVQRTYERTTGRKDFSDTFLSPASQKMLSARKAASGASAALHDQAEAILRGGK